MKYDYSVEKDGKNLAKAFGRDMPISLKDSIEISNYIRKNNIAVAKRKLNGAIDMKAPIPYKRFTNGIGHKHGPMANGRYPVKAATKILALIESAEANAMYKGMNSKDLIISYIIPKQAAKNMHYGRNYGRRVKCCHIEIFLEEAKTTKTGNVTEKTTASKIDAPKDKKTETKETKVESKETKK